MKTNQKGFTLIELMIVIAVIGIMTTAVVLQINGKQKGQQETQVAARQLEVAVREAQNNALNGIQFGGNNVCGYGVKVTAAGQLINYHLNACSADNSLSGAGDRTQQLQSVTATFANLAAGQEGYVFFTIPFGKLFTNAWTNGSMPNFQLASARDATVITSVCANENLIKDGIGNATSCGAPTAPVINCAGAFGACSLPCGGGTQVFTITTPASGGGAACLNATGDTQPCNQQACVVATCSDGIPNQGESTLADCGGPCTASANGITYNTVLGEDGNCWLASNLGTNKIATSFNDSAAYGWLFQWGRGADGHQIVSSSTTATTSNSDISGNAKFILFTGFPNDWRIPQNDNLWQGVNGINNPCPVGFRLPTKNDWSTIISAAGITNYNTAYSSSLKMTAAGERRGFDAALSYQNSLGFYWSSSPNSTSAFSVNYDSTAIDPANNLYRSYGASVRCIKN